MEKAYLWSSSLNLQGIRADTDFEGKSLKSLMKRANKLRADHVLIVGDQELEKNQLILRNMTTKEQTIIPGNDAVDAVVETITNNQTRKKISG